LFCNVFIIKADYFLLIKYAFCEPEYEFINFIQETYRIKKVNFKLTKGVLYITLLKVHVHCSQHRLYMNQLTVADVLLYLLSS